MLNNCEYYIYWYPESHPPWAPPRVRIYRVVRRLTQRLSNNNAARGQFGACLPSVPASVHSYRIFYLSVPREVKHGAHPDSRGRPRCAAQCHLALYISVRIAEHGTLRRALCLYIRYVGGVCGVDRGCIRAV